MLYKNQVFNDLTIIRELTKDEIPEGKYKNYEHLYKCKCKCGNTTIATEYDIVSGHTKSCGCLRARRTGEYARSGERERKLKAQGKRVGCTAFRMLTDNETGRSMSLSDWAKEFGISKQCLHIRLKTKSFDELVAYYKNKKESINGQHNNEK